MRMKRRREKTSSRTRKMMKGRSRMKVRRTRERETSRRTPRTCSSSFYCNNNWLTSSYRCRCSNNN